MITRIWVFDPEALSRPVQNETLETVVRAWFPVSIVREDNVFLYDRYGKAFNKERGAGPRVHTYCLTLQEAQFESWVMIHFRSLVDHLSWASAEDLFRIAMETGYGLCGSGKVGCDARKVGV